MCWRRSKLLSRKAGQLLLLQNRRHVNQPEVWTLRKAKAATPRFAMTPIPTDALFRATAAVAVAAAAAAEKAEVTSHSLRGRGCTGGGEDMLPSSSW